jgi:hypothetical protein
VGSWTVSGNPRVAKGTTLLIGGDLSIWTTCGYTSGGWHADRHGQFVGSIDGGDGPCMPAKGDPTPAWLHSVTRYEADGSGFVLTTATGTVVARLSPGGRPTPGANLLPSLADPPTATPQIRAALAAPAPLPAALRPASAADLVGGWDAITQPPRGPRSRQSPGVVFGADGGYTASDGCNGTRGRWTAGDGSFVGTGGASTLIGCNNVNVGGWIASAASAGLDGNVLVLLDRSGHELGRLQPRA